MADFVKTENGLLYKDDFSSNSLLWQLSPADYSRLERTPEGLQIHRKEDYTTYSIREPQGIRYSCYCELDHIPHDSNDIAGIVVLSNSEQYAECQLIYLPEAEDDKAFKYIKFDKISGMYTFFASHNGIDWIEIGNTTFRDSGRIGFFYHGTEDQEAIEESMFLVKNIVLHKGRYVTVDGVRESHSFKIMKDGIEIVSDDSWLVRRVKEDSILIDTYLFPMPFDGELYLYENNVILCHKPMNEICGGDVIAFTYDLSVSINNQEIDTNELFDLGVFTSNTKTIKIDIYNKEDFDINNLKIGIMSYSEYFSGAEPINISLYDEANEITEFKKEIIIEKIPASQGKSILIGLDSKTVPNFYDAANAFRFKLNIG